VKRSGPPKRRTPLQSRKPLNRGASGPTRSAPAQKPPTRGKPLGTTSGPLRAARKRRALEPGEAAWKRRRHGTCRACRRYGRLALHHITSEAKIREVASPEQIAAGICWDQANALPLGAPAAFGGNPDCQCHAGGHLPGVNDTRLQMSLIPGAAVGFAVDLLGGERAYDYFARHYRYVATDRRLAAFRPTTQGGAGEHDRA
jgi:hypothetical protein